MRPFRFVCLCLLLLTLPQLCQAQNFEKRLPRGVPETKFCGKITGKTLLGNRLIDYEVYWSATRDRNCNIVRYRTMPISKIENGMTVYTYQPEKLEWTPADKSEPTRRFYLIYKRSWKKLFLGLSPKWREFNPRSPAYQEEEKYLKRIRESSDLLERHLTPPKQAG